MNKIIARALSRTRRHAPTHAQVCTHIRTLAHAHACLHTHAHTHTHAHPRTRERMLAHTPIHTRIRQRAFGHAYTYTCICMNLHVRTHMRVLLPHLHTSAHMPLLAHPHARISTRAHVPTLGAYTLTRMVIHTNASTAHTTSTRICSRHACTHTIICEPLFIPRTNEVQSLHFCMSAFMRMIDVTC